MIQIFRISQSKRFTLNHRLPSNYFAAAAGHWIQVFHFIFGVTAWHRGSVCASRPDVLGLILTGAEVKTTGTQKYFMTSVYLKCFLEQAYLS